MKITFLSTGSKGNSIAIQTGGCTILIDIGLRKTKAEQCLLNSGIRPDEIDAIFLTHAHSDHVQGLPLAFKWGIPIFASEGTFKSLKMDLSEFDTLKHGQTTGIKGVAVRAFHTHHNDYESLGYSFYDNDNNKVSVCLDTGHVDAEMIEAMRGSTHYIIEANHDVDKVILSDYPEAVKARNLSDLGHLSNDQAAEALAQLVKGRGEKVYLCHLSKKCNTESLALHTVVLALAKKGFMSGIHYDVEVV
jgi:phosphoribosyl 1,2-cyclic phosphodiesterase